VRDDTALQMVESFYALLLAGDTTVAEATRKARGAARKAGDPTWLAYSLYAHPNARVRFPGEPPSPQGGRLTGPPVPSLG
jgi:hypothetical protein